jgi:hypothetical protein
MTNKLIVLEKVKNTTPPCTEKCTGATAILCTENPIGQFGEKVEILPLTIGGLSLGVIQNALCRLSNSKKMRCNSRIASTCAWQRSSCVLRARKRPAIEYSLTHEGAHRCKDIRLVMVPSDGIGILPLICAWPPRGCTI